MIEEIKKTVKKLFDENKIDLFIGYCEGSLPLRTTPCFIRSAGEEDQLVFNSCCSNNLAVYLPRFFPAQPKSEHPNWPRVGILATGCTARSVVGLIKEKQVPRENVVIIGVSCSGMISPSKVRDLDIVSGRENDGLFIVTDSEGYEKKIKKEELMAQACISCEHPSPEVYDIMIGSPSGKETGKYNGVAEFESMSREERFAAFTSEISKCLRCYACRAACPNCWCKECFAVQTHPKWLGITNDIADLIFYHFGRIFHQAGRCVDCGACVEACPVGIDLRKFTRKLVNDVKELYGYEAGLTLADPPPLSTYSLEDKEEFITDSD